MKGLDFALGILGLLHGGLRKQGIGEYSRVF